MTDDAAPEPTAVPTPPIQYDPVPAVARELGLAPAAVAAVVAMLDDGNTVPFIARYRKERTGGLDEVQIRAIEEQRTYVVELEARRAAILASVAEQGKLTPELEAKLRAARGKSELEDLYAPYRPRRKTRASVARERGLEPLAQRILAQGDVGDPAAEAAAFVGEAVASADDALAGARDIVAEVLADTAEIRAFARREYAEHGELGSEVVPGKADEPTKFEQYYQFKEAVKSIPSHRFLAIRRGEAEGVLRAHVTVDTARVEAGILRLARLDDGSPWAGQLRQAAADALKRLLAPSVENDVRAELKQRSDSGAVEIFAGNLRNLLVAAPLGSASVVGVDPGLRTGCKCAAIDATGKFLGTVTVYITQGDAQLARAKDDFLAFVARFTPRAIAVGNGTGGREAEAFIKRALGDAGLRGEAPDDSNGHAGAGPFVVQVNEAGASVYSASDLAREEFPELDLTIRGAISIARRLQDPLAELVKIEPKSIGVGQYQHDVHQPLLVKKLGDVVEDCVNRVGVELNTASAQLLGYVAGIGKALARKIVLHRDGHGAFASRAQLMDVSGLGPKAFEQAAGFLRIAGAAFPLDRSAVHPERYPLVEQIARDLGVELPELIGNQELIDKIDFSRYATDEIGEPTLRDIATELVKPGRDPRAEFSPPRFRDDVTAMEDLKVGMVLEGIVTNVTAFGAFVDIGVHNDGLVHVSQLAEQFVKDPSEVVKVGQKLTVRVLEVDNQRKRIALSARKGQPQQRAPRRNEAGNEGGGQRPPRNRNRGRGQGQPAGQGAHGGEPREHAQAAPGPGTEGHAQGGQPGHGGQGQDQGRPRREDRRGGREVRQWADRAERHDGPPPAHGDAPPGDRPPPEARGGRGPQGDRRDHRGPQGDRRDNRGPQGDRRDHRGPQYGGPQHGGPQHGGPQYGGSEHGGPQHDRGPWPDDRGPRPDDRGPWPDDRGPRPDDRGPRPDDRGPRPDDRGPRPDDRGPRPDDRGPPGQGRRDDRGPGDRGRPGDRGPRRDDRRPDEPAQGWGVSGFTNNPFSKLQGKGNKGRP
ncbi:MAG TPA: Tex-like N-terminal domain-containing protein [Kofleriaceae bacterium]|nr:Tex-like N-terminal domain-containing protein [Kofleriaceae bacterium]